MQHPPPSPPGSTSALGGGLSGRSTTAASGESSESGGGLRGFLARVFGRRGGDADPAVIAEEPSAEEDWKPSTTGCMPQGLTSRLEGERSAPGGVAARRRRGRKRGKRWKGRVVSVCAGWSHSVALTSRGVAYTWGCGGDGRLGLGSFSDQMRPIEVSVTQF